MRSNSGLGASSVKRIFDIFSSGIGLLILAPVFLLIGIMIKLESQGPVFFRGKRMGRYGMPFGILKFRTMLETPESYQGPKITAASDARVTKMGKWLRDSKLNELPQLWNVLVGEMSLVGPRPEDVDIAMAWENDVFREILSVRPGITSPASITYKNEEALLDPNNLLKNYFNFIQPNKIRLDLLYVRHRSFILDINVIISTFLYLLPGFKNAVIPENTIFGGRLYRFIRRYVQWIVIDTILSVLLIVVVGVIWRLIAPLNIGVSRALLFALLLSAVFSFIMNIVGANAVEWSKASTEDSFGLFLSSSIIVIIALVIEVSPYPTGLPNGFVIINTFVIATGYFITRNRSNIRDGFYQKIKNSSEMKMFLGERALIIGAGEGGNIASWLLSRDDFKRSIRLVGFVDDNYQIQGKKISGLEILGTTNDIPEIVQKYDIGLIVLAIAGMTLRNKKRIVDICDKTEKPLVDITDLLSNIYSMFSIN